MELEIKTIKLPKNISNKEIIELLMDKALTKIEYYYSKCKQFEKKYGKSFSEIKKEIEKAKEENYELWDNFILWEGYYLAYMEWKKKYEDLKIVLSNN